MNEKMKEINAELRIYANENKLGAVMVTLTDMDDYWILLGKQKIKLQIPEYDEKAVGINALEKKLAEKKEEADLISKEINMKKEAKDD